VYGAEGDFHGADLAGARVVDSGAEPELAFGHIDIGVQLQPAVLLKRIPRLRLDVQGNEMLAAAGDLAVFVVDD
jgi:hypothetical protein